MVPIATRGISPRKAVVSRRFLRSEHGLLPDGLPPPTRRSISPQRDPGAGPAGPARDWAELRWDRGGGGVAPTFQGQPMLWPGKRSLSPCPQTPLSPRSRQGQAGAQPQALAVLSAAAVGPAGGRHSPHVRHDSELPLGCTRPRQRCPCRSHSSGHFPKFRAQISQMLRQGVKLPPPAPPILAHFRAGGPGQANCRAAQLPYRVGREKFGIKITAPTAQPSSPRTGPWAPWGATRRRKCRGSPSPAHGGFPTLTAPFPVTSRGGRDRAGSCECHSSEDPSPSHAVPSGRVPDGSGAAPSTSVPCSPRV